MGRVLEACWSHGRGVWLRLTSVSGVLPCLVQSSRIERKAQGSVPGFLRHPDHDLVYVEGHLGNLYLEKDVDVATGASSWPAPSARSRWTRPDRCSHPIHTEPKLIEVTPISSTILQFRTRQHRGHVPHRAVRRGGSGALRAAAGGGLLEPDEAAPQLNLPRRQPRTSAVRHVRAGQLAGRQHIHRPAEGEADQYDIVEDRAADHAWARSVGSPRARRAVVSSWAGGRPP